MAICSVAALPVIQGCFDDREVTRVNNSKCLVPLVALTCGVAPCVTFKANASQAPAAAPAAIVQAQVDAFNKGDSDRFSSFYADDVELFDLGSTSAPTLSGRAALIARYKPMLSKYHPKATIISRIVSGSFVIDHEKTEAGRRSTTGVAIYRVEGGKIRRVWFTP
jgi:hypothetical protein